MENTTAEEKEQFHQKVREQTINYITTAFGLVAGLAWNDAIRTLIDQIYSVGEGSNIMAKFTYAAIMTLVVVFISYYLIKFVGSNKKGG